MDRIEAFWSNVNKNGPTPEHKPELGPCWLWTGATNKAGYGVFRLNGRLQYAHRISLSLKLGQIPRSRQVMHKCDNPPCVNNETHLIPGTNGMNQRDSFHKKRRTWNGKLPVPRRGEAHHKARLTEEMVREIRRLGGEGAQQMTIASMMGVNQSTVQRVLAGTAWAHVK